VNLWKLALNMLLTWMTRKSLESESNKYPHHPTEHLKENIWDLIEALKHHLLEPSWFRRCCSSNMRSLRNQQSPERHVCCNTCLPY